MSVSSYAQIAGAKEVDLLLKKQQFKVILQEERGRPSRAGEIMWLSLYPSCKYKECNPPLPWEGVRWALCNLAEAAFSCGLNSWKIGKLVSDTKGNELSSHLTGVSVSDRCLLPGKSQRP